jgi:YebC/PmpR family DNA-binding regulatory protein
MKDFTMSGHSHWATIKHKKSKEDAKRGQAFTKLIKEITVAAKAGGDPAGNPRLRLLIEKARDINMPLDNINRAIKRGTGELPGVIYEPMTYEGYGPYSIAVLVETLSDNKNRTIAELRHAFSGKGGNLGESGSVAWMFEKVGCIHANGDITEDSLFEKLLDFDIKDIKKDGQSFIIYSEPKSLEAVKAALIALNLKVEKAEVEWLSKNSMNLSDDQAEKAYEFLSQLEDLDDVQNVYTNLE